MMQQENIYKKDKTPWKAGDKIVQSDLASTLRRIRKDGIDGFYKNQTAKSNCRRNETRQRLDNASRFGKL